MGKILTMERAVQMPRSVLFISRKNSSGETIRRRSQRLPGAHLQE